jgi:sarcosine oxidase subunit beta
MPAADVIVIGGGIHGCSAALHLARLGAGVTVLEKDHVGRHASGVNAGGVRRLGRHLAEVPLAVASMELWHRIGDLVDDDCGFESHGQVKVAENDAELATLRERVREMARLGFTHEELIGASELQDIVPAIAGHCVGAIICRHDGMADPYRTTLAFKRKAENLGVRFREGITVGGLLRSGASWRIDTDCERLAGAFVVNCAGAWADGIAGQLGEPVPLAPIAPMLMITAPLAPFVRPVIGAVSRALSFKQLGNGTVLIGGGHLGHAERERNATELDFEKLAVSARTASELFPIMRKAQIVRAWAGIEARMPDEIPVIGPSSTTEGMFHAFGFSAHGFALGPIVGAILAELVVHGATNLPIAPFHIGRFGKFSGRSAMAAR